MGRAGEVVARSAVARNRASGMLFPVRIAGGPLPGTATQQYAVSADGLRFLVNLDAEQDARSSIILIDQWKPRNSRPE